MTKNHPRRNEPGRPAQSRPHPEKRSPSEKRSSSEKRPSAEKQAHADDRPHSERRPHAEKHSYSDQRPRSGKRPHGEKQASFDQRPHSDKRPHAEKQASFDQRPHSAKRPHTEKQASFDQRPHSAKRPHAEKQASFDQRPRSDQRPHAEKQLFTEKRPHPQIPATRFTPPGGRILVKGRHEVLALLASGHPVERVTLADHLKDRDLIRQVQTSAQARSIPIETLSADDFQARVGPDSQGLAAQIREFQYQDEGAFLETISHQEQSLIIALDHLEDPRNLGAIIRTAEIGGVAGILLPKNRAAEMTEWAIRTSQGAAFHLPIIRVTNLTDILRKLQKAGYWLYGLSEKATSPYTAMSFPAKTVLIAGGEDQGVSRLVQDTCDELISIPMYGRTPSLNVAVSVGIVLFEVIRQRQAVK